MFSLKRPDLIETLAARSPDSRLALRDGDIYLVDNTDHNPRRTIQVCAAPRFRSVLFQHFLANRFSLERTLHLIFGRFMMRSRELYWSAWRADIGQSTEAIVSLAARVPKAALDQALFDEICGEMRAEALSFEKELRDKFDWMRGWTPRADVPARRGGTDLRFIDERSGP